MTASLHSLSIPCMLLSWLIFALSLAGSNGTLLFAADAGTPSPTAREKLDRLLTCQQAEKDAALKENRKAQAKIADIETFIGSLTDQPVHYAAHEKANRALTLAREALAKVDERIRLADFHLNMTLRAIKNLPEGPTAKDQLPSQEWSRQTRNWWNDAERYGREVHGYFLKDYGFVNDPSLETRLEGILSRLQMMSPRPDVPIKVKVLAKESGYGAAATANTVYFDKAYLDTTPSESQLLFVAAHELAHVQLGHFGEYSNKLRSGQAQDSARYVLGTEDRVVSNEEGRSPNADAILQDRLKVRLSSFSKDQELQADLLGAQQALAAGASPKGIQEAMAGMIRDRQIAQASLSDFDRMNTAQRQLDKLTADHPEPEERLKALEDSLGGKFWERTNLKINSACPR